jgi:ribose transport system ATP-binding protein
MTAAQLLAMRDVSKSFFGNRVLSGVDLDLRAGEVHAVVGENGAGKSTLMKILAGVHRPDSGSIELSGKQVEFGHPSAAQAAGIAIIYQELTLLGERTVAENVFLGREPARAGVVDRRRMVAETARLLAEVGETSFGPRARVRALSVAQQQVVEILKALVVDAKVVVMDEPTASLADHEVELLYKLVRRLQDRGIGVLYVSHRLREVFDLASRVTVLKDGALVSTVDTTEIDVAGLVRLMVGRSLEAFFPPRATPEEIGAVRLEIRDAGRHRLRSINLSLRAGEIVGVAGLQGSGRTSLARALFGVSPFTTGETYLNGKRVRLSSPRRAIRAGLGYVTEDRKSEGLALRQQVRHNALLAARGVGRHGVSVRALLASVELTGARLETETQYLSGGNQQKVVLAKWLAVRPRVMIFDEPTRGIDVGAKFAIYSLMRGLARDGVAILMISSELPELIGMADRILVMRDHTIAAELPAGASEEEIMHAAVHQEAVR